MFRAVVQVDSKDKYVNAVSESERKTGQVYVYLKVCSKERVTESKLCRSCPIEQEGKKVVVG